MCKRYINEKNVNDERSLAKILNECTGQIGKSIHHRSNDGK
jgi:hypothetical protein